MPVRRLLCLLAATLSLTGCGVSIGGGGSSRTAAAVKVAKWRVGRVNLDPETAFALRYPGMGDRDRPPLGDAHAPSERLTRDTG